MDKSIQNLHVELQWKIFFYLSNPVLPKPKISGHTENTRVINFGKTIYDWDLGDLMVLNGVDIYKGSMGCLMKRYSPGFQILYQSNLMNMME